MEITAAYFLTGEAAGTGLPRAKRPFDPSAGHWGALQVLSRYSHLEVDGDVFVNDLQRQDPSGRADQWTFAANWYPSAVHQVVRRPTSARRSTKTLPAHDPSKTSFCSGLNWLSKPAHTVSLEVL